MYKRITIGMILLVLALTTVACSSNGSPTKITAKWIKPQIAGENALIPASEVASNKITHFGVSTEDADMAFMAYELKGDTYVRSNICPPCRSVGFSLQGNALVCDSCATKFEATTGQGIEGACVDFPKAPVSYKLADGNIVINADDLILAYRNTLEPGLP